MESVDVSRVLVAVDISYATGPTITEAINFARLFAAQLRILHVVEPLPMIAALPIALDQDAYYRLSEEQFEEAVAQLPREVQAEKVLRRGASDDAVAKEVEDWKANVLAVGSHGKGWVDRLLVGSTTERILNHLPTSTLVVPVADPNPAPSLAS
jgi:nucleotide-binding universal stress UspA family protein